MYRKYASFLGPPRSRFASSSASKSALPSKKPPVPPQKKTYIGQPTSETHPHLLKPGEVTPGIQLIEYRERRERLCDSILRAASNNAATVNRHMIIVPGAGKKYMSEKIPYVFRQSTDFLYLTGCLEPDSLLCLTAESTRRGTSIRSTLFVNPRDAYVEKWEGPRTGTERAVDAYGVDEALPHAELLNFVTSFAKEESPIAVWYDYANSVGMSSHKKLMEFLQARWHESVESPRRMIQTLRLIKSEAEVQLMRKTCEIASESFADVMAFTQSGRLEGDLWASMEYSSRLRGANYLAYPPVVAGGPRANVIHYIANNQVLRDGDLVLMDAGCHFHGYCSDITRTWPVSGRFDPYQRALYEMLLKVQQEMLAMASTHPTLDAMFRGMCQILGSELQHLGVLPKSLSPAEAAQKAYSLCPHHVSHYLGMDVHDTSLIPRNRRLEPGMVITIEPGVYLDSENDDVPVEFRGLGMRIEDDVLVTQSGVTVLTAECPSSVEGVEKACQGLS